MSIHPVDRGWLTVAAVIIGGAIAAVAVLALAIIGGLWLAGALS